MSDEYRRPEVLEELYAEKGLSSAEIAEKYDVSPRTVLKYINRYSIERRKPEYGQKDKLKHMYVDKRMKVQEIADKYGVSKSSVGYWIQKHDIMRPWNDDNLLKEMYVEQDMTQEEIADEMGCEQGTISYRLREMGVETNPDREKSPYYGMTGNAYMTVQHKVNGEQKSILVHRLLAVAEYGIASVADSVVHHKNGVKWDNRTENIVVMDRGEHTRLHHNRGDL